MPESTELLKMRILICFLKMSPENCTVTNLSKTLVVEKYTISRAMIALEKDGFLDRSDSRHPRLTRVGIQMAERYRDRMEIAVSHLMYEGVSPTNAQIDAGYLSLYCSDETFQMIQRMEERYHIQHVLKGRKQFDGSDLCRHLRDGSYVFPFMIYKENVEGHNNISMANDGFEHPCELVGKKSKGLIRLKAVSVVRSSTIDGKKMQGKICNMKYFDGAAFCDAERNGDFLQFPAEMLQFINMGSGIGTMFHGSVCLKMDCSVGPLYMPESTANITIMI